MSKFLIPSFVLIKPAGFACNLKCNYCFYSQNDDAGIHAEMFMNEETLEIIIRRCIENCAGPEITFCWQGGEPTLVGLNFYKRVVKLQQYYSKGLLINNSIQTNGILLDDEWGKFLSENKFLVGISLDGPQQLNDYYRKDFTQRGSFKRVAKAIEILRGYLIPSNILTTINRQNVSHPDTVYSFLKATGFQHFQFIPVVEFTSKEFGCVTQDSITAMQFGEFLCAVFDQWVVNDVGKFYVQLFDAALASWLQLENKGYCPHHRKCGGVVFEADGTIYPCDHFVRKDYCLGNITDKDFIDTDKLENFFSKKIRLMDKCKECRFLFACNGGCPKDKLHLHDDGQNYLCDGYRFFFDHIEPCMNFMANEIIQHRPPTNIMKFLRNRTDIIYL